MPTITETYDKLTALQKILLYMLHTQEEPWYAKNLIEETGWLSGEVYRVLYSLVPTFVIRRYEDVEKWDEDGDAGPRRVYQLTPYGRIMVAELNQRAGVTS